MRVVTSLIVSALVAACGQATAPSTVSPPARGPEVQEFDAAREEAASLITGVVFQWNRASEESKNLYALSSVDAIGVPEADRAMYARVFRRCMDEEAARASSGASLGDLSYDCAAGIRYAATQ